jgi:hypothetical protein
MGISLIIDQSREINSLDWDVLVILDACRYDFFKEEYQKYFSGTLRLARSRGQDTPGWLMRTWTHFYPVVYFSASPYVDNHNIRWEDSDWKPTNHFMEIVYIRSFAWDEALKTVTPSAVNKAVEELYDPRKMTIIHYIQPHGPWIGETKLPLTRVELLRDVDPKLLRNAYRDNLRLVLQHVKEILNVVKGKIIITSDHSELLGEDGYYLHPGPQKFHIKMSMVPWIEIFK